MENKKVCHISIVHKVNDIRIFHKECVSLCRHGYEVTYLYSGKENKVCNNVKIIGMGYKKIRRVYQYFFADRAIIKKALSLENDIYHIHDPELIRFAKKIKKKNKKVIYDSHENTPMQMMEKEWIPKILRPIFSKLSDVIERKGASYCDLVFVVANATYDRFKQFHNNVVMLENLPIKKEFEDIKIDYDRKNRQQLFCYSGAIWKERGLDSVCKPFHKVKNAKLKIAGRIDAKNLDDYIKHLPKNVSYLGYQSREKVHELYEASMCGLCLFKAYPNNMIDPPTKIFEYMAAGIPVICSNFKSMEDTVLTYQCGISVDPDCYEDIQKAIIYMIEHKDQAQKMGENGRKVIMDFLNWETHEKVLIEAYGRIK